MPRAKQHILLIMDNAPRHILSSNDHEELGDFDPIHLSNMLLMFLPKNTTSIVQPLDIYFLL